MDRRRFLQKMGLLAAGASCIGMAAIKAEKPVETATRASYNARLLEAADANLQRNCFGAQKAFLEHGEYEKLYFAGNRTGKTDFAFCHQFDNHRILNDGPVRIEVVS